MNIVIINHTINTTNIEINKFSSKILRGDNKNLLHTFPYIPLTSNGWKIIYYEDLIKLNANTIEEKIQIYLKTNVKIETILFFRANTLITKYWEEIKNLNVYKIIYIDDLHNSREIHELRILDKNIFNYFNLVLSTYAYCFSNFFQYIKKEKIYWFPHSFNEILSIKYNLEPKNEIFLSGCMNAETYPMRQKMFELKDKYQIDVLSHPKYCKNKLHNITGKKFIEKINEYRFAFTCCSNKRTPYMVQKFFEIPGSGALLIAYDKHIKPQMIELGFKDMINYISVDEINLEEKIQWVLDPNNLEIIEKIRLEGYNFINSTHTHEIRIKNLLLYLNNKNL
jgi:hypothetical protein